MKSAHLTTVIALVAVCHSASASAQHAANGTYVGPCAHQSPIAAALWGTTPNRGVIEGRVRQIQTLTDTSEHPLNDTEVAISGPVERTALVDGNGEFRLANLPAGNYAVVVRHDGFPTRRDSLVIDTVGAIGDIRLRRDVHHPACSTPLTVNAANAARSAVPNP